MLLRSRSKAKSIRLWLVLALIVPLSMPPSAGAATLPENFIEQTVVAGLDGPVGMKWMPDGRLIILEQSGIVKIAEPGSGLPPVVVLDISGEVNDWSDRGLIGAELHPNFPTTPELFLVYTYDPPETSEAVALYDGNDGPNRRVEYGEPDGEGQRVARLVRWDLNAATNFTSVVEDSDVVLLGDKSSWDNIGDPYTFGDDIDTPWACEVYDQPGDPVTSGTPAEDCVASDVFHGIGTIRFGTDGMLYVGAGDGATPDLVDPRALRAQNLDSLSGKILRIDPSTGEGLPDNPFYNNDPSSNRSKVFHYGLRNPFRFTVDPGSGDLLIGDVGWNSFEEINSGPAGANFGWPCYEGGLSMATMDAGILEGPGENRLGPAYSQMAECSPVIAAGTSVPPLWAWCHTDAHPNCTLGLASAYAGAVVQGTNYPPQYRGLWFGDIYGSLQVRDLVTGDVELVSPDIAFPVDMSVGPDGDVYYISAATSSVVQISYSDVPVPTCLGVDVTVDISAGETPTEGPDVILGTELGETILGLGGDDLICAGGGDDVIDGGDGNDTIEGDLGNDELRGGVGNDQLYGGEGADTLFGETGLDYLVGGPGVDSFFGGPDRDFLEGSIEGETMNGEAGNDTILGHGGDDILNGGPDSDYLWGGPGVDVFNGGDGVDHLEGGPEGETMNGGAGDDIILGFGGDDTLNGGADSDYLWGGDGIDTFDGGDGVDHLEGGPEGETMSGGLGNDIVLGWGGDDILNGGPGVDYLWGGDGVDLFNGGGDRDRLEGGPESETMNGEGGDDIILGFDGDDTLVGGPGSDYIWGGLGVDIFYGSDGPDYLDGGAEGERMEGGPGDDNVIGREGDDILIGGDGLFDFCSTGTGTDTVDASCEFVG